MTAPRPTFAQWQEAARNERLRAAGHAADCGSYQYRGCTCGVEPPPELLPPETTRKLARLHQALSAKVSR